MTLSCGSYVVTWVCGFEIMIKHISQPCFDLDCREPAPGAVHAAEVSARAALGPCSEGCLAVLIDQIEVAQLAFEFTGMLLF